MILIYFSKYMFCSFGINVKEHKESSIARRMLSGVIVGIGIGAEAFAH